MTLVPTATTPVDTADLGFTLMHEHVLVLSPGVVDNFPVWDREAELPAAVERCRAAMARGVRTMVDLTPGDWRDVPFVVEVARKSGMQIIVATGLYWDPPRYFRGRSIDHMADLFVSDITEGIMDTGVRAAIIKCATDETGVTEDVDKVLRAAARAHRRTGVPISTHTWAAGRVGLLQQDIFESEGVDLGRVTIGHSGDSDDLEYLTTMMRRGSYIGMDRFGDEVRLSTEKRVDTIARLCAMGYAHQIVLSHDASCYMDWFDREWFARERPNRVFTYIPDTIIPALKAAGVPQAQIHTMTVENPRTIFERNHPY